MRPKGRRKKWFWQERDGEEMKTVGKDLSQGEEIQESETERDRNEGI